MKKKQINDVPADVSAKMKTESLRDTLMDLANYGDASGPRQERR